MIKTKFAGGINPFTGKPVDDQPDNEIVLEDEAIFSRWNGWAAKYSAKFLRAINDGLPIRCSVEGAPRAAKRMRNFIKERGLAGSVRSKSDCGDGYGRIWYVKAAEARQATPHPQ